MTRPPDPLAATGTPFHGPQELAPLWDRFVALYARNGTAQHNIQSATMLDEVAFVDGGKRLLNACRDDPQAIARLRLSIDIAARALSEHAQHHSALRPLQRQVLAGLVRHWVSLRRNESVDTSAPLSRAAHVTEDEYAAAVDQQESLLRKPQAAMLAGAIEFAEGEHIQRIVEKTARTMPPGVAPADAEAIAHNLFQRSLFQYQPNGSGFSGYLDRGLKTYLPLRLLDIRPKERQDVPTVPFARSDPTREATSNCREHSPVAVTDDAEERRALRKALARLTDREREVLLLRYGLASDGKCHTLEEVGELLGITRQRVSQIEQRAIHRCRRFMPKSLSLDFVFGSSVNQERGR